jgi:hypothetical protein
MALEKVSEEKKAMAGADAELAKLRKIPGSEYIYNRLPKKFEKTFDGAPYVFEPHEIRLMPEAQATWFWAHTVISYEPVTGTEVRALVTTQDPMFGVPYDEPIGPELIDRSMAQPIKVDGLTLKPSFVPVKGGGFESGKAIERPERV